MSIIFIVVIPVLLFGGGWGYSNRSTLGPGYGYSFGGIIVFILIVWLVLHLLRTV